MYVRGRAYEALAMRMSTRKRIPTRNGSVAFCKGSLVLQVSVRVVYSSHVTIKATRRLEITGACNKHTATLRPTKDVLSSVNATKVRDSSRGVPANCQEGERRGRSLHPESDSRMLLSRIAKCAKRRASSVRMGETKYRTGSASVARKV